MIQNLRVLKFGSSVLRDRESLVIAAHEVYRHLRSGSRVLAVVSAIGDTTDRLLAEARAMESEPTPEAMATLLAAGEREAASLFVMALERAGIPVTGLDPTYIGLEAEGPADDAMPAAVDRESVFACLAAGRVGVVPGFFGRRGDGSLALFGRGGSDLTALFLAHALGARSCRLIKDVPGIFDRDPASAASTAGELRRFARLDWRTARAYGGRVVQKKALEFSESVGLAFEIGAPGRPPGSVVAEGPPVAVVQGVDEGPRLRVGLLGLGTVGGGVARLVLADPRFELVGALVRDTAGHAGDRVSSELLTSDHEDVEGWGADVIVELMGANATSELHVRRALAKGVDVVTANKVLVAGAGPELEALGLAHGARLAYSASVGGSVPMIEEARRLAALSPVEGFEGVLNGTTNFVLDRMEEGVPLDEAVALAQERGFAEADPRADLDGSDAASKAVILARAAFGDDVVLRWRERQGLLGLSRGRVRAARERGERLRLVVECRRRSLESSEVWLSVRLEALEEEHLLAGVRGEENALVLRAALEPFRVVRGKGAGRWPTAEAVLGDLVELVGATRRRRMAEAG